MVQMSEQDMKNLAQTMSPPAEDPDDKNNHDMYNHPAHQESGDPRDRKPTYDLYKVDFKWVTKQTSKKELKAAYLALKEDGGFEALLAHTLARLKEVDP